MKKKTIQQQEKETIRRYLAKGILGALVLEKQWSHEALVRNAVELADELLLQLEETA